MISHISEKDAEEKSESSLRVYNELAALCLCVCVCVCCSMVAQSAWPYLIAAVTMAAAAHIIRKKEEKGGAWRSRRCADEGKPLQPQGWTSSRSETCGPPESPFTPPSHSLYTPSLCNTASLHTFLMQRQTQQLWNRSSLKETGGLKLMA